MPDPLRATLLTLAATGLGPFVASQDEPTDKQTGDKPQIAVRVDPRIELLSIVFRLAGNPEYSQGRVPVYTKAVEAWFGPHKEHEVVKQAKRLRIDHPEWCKQASELGSVSLQSTAGVAQPVRGRVGVLERRRRELFAISHELEERNGVTHVSLSQDNNPTEEAAEHSRANWEKMLAGLKQVVEGD